MLITSSPIFANLQLTGLAWGGIENTIANTFVTTKPLINVFVQVNATYTYIGSSLFSMPTNGTLRYNGSIAETFWIEYSGVVNGTATFVYSFVIYINGLQITKTTTIGHVLKGTGWDTSCKGFF